MNFTIVNMLYEWLLLMYKEEYLNEEQFTYIKNNSDLNKSHSYYDESSKSFKVFIKDRNDKSMLDFDYSIRSRQFIIYFMGDALNGFLNELYLKDWYLDLLDRKYIGSKVYDILNGNHLYYSITTSDSRINVEGYDKYYELQMALNYFIKRDYYKLMHLLNDKSM